VSGFAGLGRVDLQSFSSLIGKNESSLILHLGASVKSPVQIYEETLVFYDARHLQLEREQDLGDSADVQVSFGCYSLHRLYNILS
jgi:hypothetical protein